MRQPCAEKVKTLLIPYQFFQNDDSQGRSPKSACSKCSEKNLVKRRTLQSSSQIKLRIPSRKYIKNKILWCSWLEKTNVPLNSATDTYFS